ncbi:BrnT family toxin [Labrys sp. LIt4]|uniref:BrnT family toxin n=1 Tax=Labrys sp. LIt4 TaxID=2821355 RepID=UPI001AE01C34|nr:BrnT family toxin [Labrys sp. LIt4]
MTQFDPLKNSSNLSKHGVALSTAEDFDWETALIEEDRTEAYGEQRERAIGFIGERLFVYVYTLRGEEDHAISLRAADRKDKKRYEEHIRKIFGF